MYVCVCVCTSKALKCSSLENCSMLICVCRCRGESTHSYAVTYLKCPISRQRRMSISSLSGKVIFIRMSHVMACV